MRKFFIGSLLLGAISTTFIAKANGQNITAADLRSADIDSYTELGIDGRDQISSIDQFGDIRPTDWAYQAIKQVGNYGEIYERTVEPLGIARAGSVNDLWTRGGIIYSPPIR